MQMKKVTLALLIGCILAATFLAGVDTTKIAITNPTSITSYWGKIMSASVMVHDANAQGMTLTPPSPCLLDPIEKTCKEWCATRYPIGSKYEDFGLGCQLGCTYMSGTTKRECYNKIIAY